MQSQERLRALASELSLAEQRERKRLATELHDHLQQMLVCGKMAIGGIQQVAADTPDRGRFWLMPPSMPELEKPPSDWKGVMKICT